MALNRIALAMLEKPVIIKMDYLGTNLISRFSDGSIEQIDMTNLLGRGPAGPIGPQGPAGPAGTPGATGPVGPQGPQGVKGNTGATGPEGPVGPAGTGSTGPMGPAGPTGPVGPKGTNGATGPAGPVGPVGPKGAAGATGATGSMGPVGPAGPKGATGATGQTGPVGPAGPRGTTGATGPAGPVGPVGPQGPKGETGPAGPPSTGGGIGSWNYLGLMSGFVQRFPTFKGKTGGYYLLDVKANWGAGIYRIDGLYNDGTSFPIDYPISLVVIVGDGYGWNAGEYGAGTTQLELSKWSYPVSNSEGAWTAVGGLIPVVYSTGSLSINSVRETPPRIYKLG